MSERHRDTNETRARALATQDRNYWVGLLETVDTWFPVYRVRHPDADRAQVVERLASLVDERRRGGFPDHAAKPRALPDTAVLFETPIARRNIKDFLDTPFSTTSGVVKGSAFKIYDLESKRKRDTRDLHTFSPIGGGSNFSNTHGALFWLGFSRLDSTWDQLDIFDGSPSDRVQHMAVLQVSLPPPTVRVVAQISTSMFITLAQGAEVINDWGLFDDEDDASLTIEFCGAFTRDGAGFPAPEAFGFRSGFSVGWSTHEFFSLDADMSRTVVLSPGDKPSLYLGMRWTFAGADSRVQTGFTQEQQNAFFGFQHPDTGVPGVRFAYEPELVVAQ